MDQTVNKIFFALIRSAIRGVPMSEEEKSMYSPQLLPSIGKMASKHDLAHLIVHALKENRLLDEAHKHTEQVIVSAVFRYERINYDLKKLCSLLEDAQIPFIPLKGSVLRQYYREPWMRTSCDIDVLVHHEDLERAIEYLIQNGGYTDGLHDTHDVSLYTPSKTHIELHFDLVEEGRANSACDVLKSVWDNASPKDGYRFLYSMSDEFFYFYHMAHMAKHFETGGCGVRPFIDLWILDNISSLDDTKRDALLLRSGLMKFTESARALSKIWLEGGKYDVFLLQFESFILTGGVYGNASNRVALNQSKSGGRFGYILSRMFVSYEMLVRYYPVLEKHRWLMPLMQVRRWLKVFDPRISKMAKRELETNSSIDRSSADEMGRFLTDIGLG